MAGTVTFIGVGGTEAKVVDGTTVTGWVSSASVAVNTDNFLIGSSSISDKVSNSTQYGYGLGAGLVGEPWDFSSGGSDDGNHIFIIVNGQGAVDTLANGGFGIVVADDLATDSVGVWYVGPQAGSLGGWEYFVINPSEAFDAILVAGTATWTVGGNPSQLSGVDGIGCQWKITNTVMGASDNAFLQSVSVGVGYRVTGASSLFSDFSSFEQTNRYGALQVKAGVVFPLCQLRVGVPSGAGNTTFTEDGFAVIWQGQSRPGGGKATAVGFYGFFIDQGTGTTDVTLSNGSMQASTPEFFDLNLSGGNSVTIANLAVDRARVVVLDSGVDWDLGQVQNSGLITASGAIFTGVTVREPTVAADASALLWNDAGDPDGNLDDCTFVKHSSTAHHAIEFGSSAPTTMTLTGIDFQNFNASNGNNDSALNFTDGSGKNYTVNLVGCSGNISYKVAGTSTVTLVTSVPVTVEVVDEADAPIQNVQVAVYVGATEVLNTDTNASGIASGSYGGTTPAAAIFRCRKSSTGATKYFAVSGPATIEAGTGMAVKVVLRVDTTAAP